MWEVDDDNDEQVDWEEFRIMFYRIRDDETGNEPRKLFNVVDFLMLDKNHSGSVDMDECLTMLWGRHGKEKVEEKMAEMKAANHPSLQADAANEKSVNFSFFAEIQRLCRKTQILKPGATVVAKVADWPPSRTKAAAPIDVEMSMAWCGGTLQGFRWAAARGYLCTRGPNLAPWTLFLSDQHADSPASPNA